MPLRKQGVPRTSGAKTKKGEFHHSMLEAMLRCGPQGTALPLPKGTARSPGLRGRQRRGSHPLVAQGCQDLARAMEPGGQVGIAAELVVVAEDLVAAGE